MLAEEADRTSPDPNVQLSCPQKGLETKSRVSNERGFYSVGRSSVTPAAEGNICRVLSVVQGK